MAQTATTSRPQLAEPRGNRDLMTLPIGEAIEAYTPQFQAALPDHIPVARFKRVLVTAINQNADLARCNRHSLFLAAVKCAQDGLYPDGREAALVPFGQVVQYMPMVTGLRRLMASEVVVATTEVVHQNDRFRYVLGDDAAIEHEPPPLDQDRGEPIGAYCSIKLRTGGYIREVMSKADIERIRNLYSKATRDDAPWKLHWGEMARKTVLKRAAKQVAFSPEISRAFERDDEADSSRLVIDHAFDEAGDPPTEPEPPRRPRGRPPGSARRESEPPPDEPPPDDEPQQQRRVSFEC
jgi:recombination protein RecT